MTPDPERQKAIRLIGQMLDDAGTVLCVANEERGQGFIIARLTAPQATMIFREGHVPEVKVTFKPAVAARPEGVNRATRRV